MRLLHTKTAAFCEVTNPSKVRYAILSHIWSRAGEMSYQDVELLRREFDEMSSTSFLSTLPEKIQHACRLARTDGFSYIWIDTCCIDKTSSAELSEAINSMYTWYRHASVCYAFLADVPHDEDPRQTPSNCRVSRWFERGWTLQELIAPRTVAFLSSDWRFLRTLLFHLNFSPSP